jgi:hypothetical protein
MADFSDHLLVGSSRQSRRPKPWGHGQAAFGLAARSATRPRLDGVWSKCRIHGVDPLIATVLLCLQ